MLPNILLLDTGPLATRSDGKGGVLTFRTTAPEPAGCGKEPADERPAAGRSSWRAATAAAARRRPQHPNPAHERGSQ